MIPPLLFGPILKKLFPTLFTFVDIAYCIMFYIEISVQEIVLAIKLCNITN